MRRPARCRQPTTTTRTKVRERRDGDATELRMPTNPRQIGSRRQRDLSGVRQPKVQLFRPEGTQSLPLRGHDGRCAARPGALSAPGLDHLVPGRHPDLFQGLDGGQELELAPVPRGRPGMGANPLPAPVDDLRHGAEHHRERPQIRSAQALRPRLGEDPRGPSRRLQTCRVRPRHVDHAGTALRLHADGQQRHPDERLLQAAFRPGPHALL